MQAFLRHHPNFCSARASSQTRWPHRCSAPRSPHRIMAQQLSADEVWAGLTDVERTALHALVLRTREAKIAKNPTTGEPLYTDPYGDQVVARCVPVAMQEKIMNSARTMGGDRLWATVRTIEIDRLLQLALTADTIPQVVIVGAGMDLRAWRLQWPAGMRLFEVDTPSMLAFKARVVEGSKPACQRRELGLDLRDPQRLGPMLQDAGHDTSTPTFWLLEGFIGYLNANDAANLLKVLHALSAPGSVLVMTAPPTPEQLKDYVARGVKLQHATFEQPEDTMARANAAGWQGVLVSAEEQQNRHGINDLGMVQPMLVLHKH